MVSILSLSFMTGISMAQIFLQCQTPPLMLFPFHYTVLYLDWKYTSQQIGQVLVNFHFTVPKFGHHGSPMEFSFKY